MSRVVKTDVQNKKLDGGKPHREHRSKKGRHYKPDYWHTVRLKREAEKEKAKELDKALSTL